MWKFCGVMSSLWETNTSKGQAPGALLSSTLAATNMAACSELETLGRSTVKHLSPLRTIRKECLACCGDSSPMVAECRSKTCAFVPYRFGKRPDPEEIGGRPSPLHAIREHCQECGGFEVTEIAKCRENGICRVWQFRTGHSPFRQGKSGRDLKTLQIWKKRVRLVPFRSPGTTNSPPE